MGRYCENKKMILIISGGMIDEKWFVEWIKHNETIYCIAADKGLETAFKFNITPDYILGDYDSVDTELLEHYKDNTEVVTYKPEKDYTDTHIALKKAIETALSQGSIDDICICLTGATGTRLDHTLTNIYILNEALESGVNAFIADAHNKIYIKDSSFKINKNEQYGKYVSFIPMTDGVKLTLEGMKYGLEDYLLTQKESICQSNEIVNDTAIITVNSGKIVVVESDD